MDLALNFTLGLNAGVTKKVIYCFTAMNTGPQQGQLRRMTGSLSGPGTLQNVKQNKTPKNNKTTY